MLSQKVTNFFKLTLLTTLLAAAQQSSTAAVRLSNHVHPSATPEADRGSANASTRIVGMTLHFKRSAAQQADLDQLLKDQQNPASPGFHKWLEPTEFGARFGAAQTDIDRASRWLQSQGFSVDSVPASRNSIVFSGNVRQVERGFQISMHRFEVNGKTHLANLESPALPDDLFPIVESVRGLADFGLRSPGAPVNTRTNFTTGSGAHNLTPGDFATIYNLTPLFQTGINGTGQKIAVVGECKIAADDFNLFRSTYGLPPSTLQIQLANPGADPGPFDPTLSSCIEASLDVEWTSATAPGAQIQYVYSKNAQDAIESVVANKSAQIVSVSFSACEPTFIAAGNIASFRNIAQQASATGISLIVSSGDSGAADCEVHGSKSVLVASSGLNVNALASSPEVTAVGGTQMNEGSGTYWSATNKADGSSALSYIPESGWNETGAMGLVGSGGGYSGYFLQPMWQTGAGVPIQNWRTIPDVSLAAAGGIDGYAYISGGVGGVAGGTSFAAPSFAGIVALLNQYWGAKGLSGGLGNLNPTLYRLAVSTPAAFHDITTGNNIVPCKAGSAGCATGSYGYKAGPGYDLVTGLGSVDANVLVTEFGNRYFGTTMSLSATPNPVPLNGASVVTATVKAASGSAIPTGRVNFSIDSVSYASALLDAKGTASVTLPASQLNPVVGTSYPINAAYPGDPSFSGSAATLSLKTVSGTGNAAVTATLLPQVARQSLTAGACPVNLWTQYVVLEESNGVGVTIQKLTGAGVDLTSSIVQYFGSATLPAFGSLAGGFCWKAPTTPFPVTYQIQGVDDNGKAVSVSVSGSWDVPAAAGTAFGASVSQIAQALPNTAGSVSVPVTITAPAGSSWTASLSPGNSTTKWVTIVPSSGTGTTNVTVTFSGTPTGMSPLAPGDHRGVIWLSSPNSNPQAIPIPLLLNIGTDITRINEPFGGPYLSVNPALGCPGYYTAVLGLRPGATDGTFGAQILLTAGQRYLQGGVNLGGGFAPNGGSPGFAAFTISNPNNEPQVVNVSLAAQALAGSTSSTLGVVLQFLDGAHNPVGPSISQTSNNGTLQITASRTLDPGFYILSIQSASGSAAGNFQLSANTSFIDPSRGGAFQGGVVVGGYLITPPNGVASPGFAGFCISDAQNITINAYSSGVYGPAGASSVYLQLLDSQGHLYWNADPSASFVPALSMLLEGFPR